MGLRQIFCKHRYSVMGQWPCTHTNSDGTKVNVDVTFLECVKCGHRRVVKFSDFYYRETIPEFIQLWKRHLIDINFEKVKTTDYKE